MADKFTYDVYVRPFVPQSDKDANLNILPILPSTPARWIDFNGYVRSFAGGAFLQALPPSVDIPEVAEEVYGPLDADTYRPFFLRVMAVEGKVQQEQASEFSMYRVPLQIAPKHQASDVFWLEVPGLRELSLRVEIGDVVHLRQLRFDAADNVLTGTAAVDFHGRFFQLAFCPDVQHDAVVYRVDRAGGKILLKVDALRRQSMLFNVCFSAQRGRLLALSSAVQNTQALLLGAPDAWIRSMLFPDTSHGVMQEALNKRIIDIDLFDPVLNYEQTRATQNIYLRNYGQVPYIISGPPGTGKTKTLVEACLQLLRRDKDAHLLVCAPSDPAADTLTQRLGRELRPQDLLRLNSPARSFPEVPGAILPFCFIDDVTFALPPFANVMKCRIVVTTCQDAQLLNTARLSNRDLLHLELGIRSTIHPLQELPQPLLHWTGLFLDEGAQALEPEALIPMLVVAPPDGYQNALQTLPLFVIAGDPHQLGPRTASRNKDLQKSLLERLMERPLYRDHILARSKQTRGVMRPLTKDLLPIIRPPFTNLIRNYRSHPSILAFPSSRFYFDTLEPEGVETDTLLAWNEWRGTKWPVLFVPHNGPDERVLEGEGWFNISEARLACHYAQSIIKAGLVQQEHVAIMSPFRAQVRLLRKMSKEPQYRDACSRLNIGPLEAFQGLESTMVILCTTRTRDRFVSQDLERGHGVIQEPHRLNVALTRAKAGLVVIGSPPVLVQDEAWLAFMSFCYRNDLWVKDNGSDSEWSPPVSFPHTISRLERQLLLEQERDEGDDGTRYLRDKHLGIDHDRDEWQKGLDAADEVMNQAYDDNDEHEQ